MELFATLFSSLPVFVYTTNPTAMPGPTVSWRPHTTKPTKPSATSSNYLRLLDLRFVEVFLFTITGVRI
jgi:hypothetical protein